MEEVYMLQIRKRDGSLEEFIISKVSKAIENVAKSYGMPVDDIKKALGDALVTGVTEDIVKEKAINLLVRYSVEE